MIGFLKACLVGAILGFALLGLTVVVLVGTGAV